MNPRRILILGNPGSGKNWLGQRLAEKYGLPFQDLDNIKWKTKYVLTRNDRECEPLLKKFVRKPAWLIVGVPCAWAFAAEVRAQYIIILRKPFVVESYRILRRYFQRTGQHHETLRKALRLVKWNWQEFHRKKGYAPKHYQGLLQRYPKKTIVLESKKAVAQILRKRLKSQSQS